MKNLIALFCVASAVTAFAADTSATSDNVFGVLRVDIGDVEEAIIAVPWLDPGTGNDINVTDVIKTANLNEGDQLYYYNTQSGKYQVWQLKSDKTWEKPTIVNDDKFEAPSDVGMTLARGNAILLKRPTPTSPAVRASSVYLYGQVPTATTAEVTMAQGLSDKAAYTLIAPPAVEDVDLNNDAIWSDVCAGDYIILPTKEMLVYVPTERGGTEKKWGFRTGYNQVSHYDTFDYEKAVIKAGQGAWFASGAGAKTAAKVTWKKVPHVAAPVVQ